ncbi:anthranilate phosphoribosyltransferase [Gracilibacillus boraciitolerans JCM 21714]|uniref:Anthranilate phosphoribosyltransferase n=1 Tax=Gracilibacillus boraciitolerans JCM 21714 TaxID=1298598 RepID=W4VMG1_9BACI|nr:anthranilate phosphoribosyltransferase [Gracilibacillus boraciitolerans JCM 21714]
MVLLDRGDIMKFTLHPEEVNLPVVENELIRGGDSKENAEILRNVLEGKKGPHRDTVLLNAGLGILLMAKQILCKKGGSN